jgi:UrcA family protein
MRPTAISCKLLGLAAAVTLLGAGAPAFSAESAGEIATRAKSSGNDGRSASASVNARDLDLTTASGRRELALRVRTAAKELCRTFHEGPTNSAAVGFACEDEAVASAGDSQRAANEQASPRTYATAAHWKAAGDR